MTLAQLQPPRRDVQPYFDRLLPHCQDYCQTVSKRAMALAIETCAYVWWLCDFKQARTVADLGSGFSSYVLRRYAAEADYDVTVHSVDSSADWLAKSEAYCMDHGLTDGEFLMGADWARLDCRYDVIVHDYDGGAVREEFATIAGGRLEPNGCIVFDDAQHPGHHGHFAQTCIRHRLALLDLYHQTIDESGRFAAMGVRT